MADPENSAFLFGPVITVDLKNGKRHPRIQVHETVLCRSPFVAEKVAQLKIAKQDILRIAGMETWTIMAVCNWLYQEQKDLERAVNRIVQDPRFSTICSDAPIGKDRAYHPTPNPVSYLFWILASVLQLPKLQNELVRRMHQFMAEQDETYIACDGKFAAECVAFAYRRTPAGSKLRLFIIDWIVFQRQLDMHDVLSRLPSEPWKPEVLIDVAVRLAQENARPFGSVRSFPDVSKFLVNEDDEVKTAGN